MTEDNLRELLGYVNKMREALGEKPINRIKRGEARDSSSCPLANSLAGEIEVMDSGRLRAPMSVYKKVKKVVPCHPTEECHWRSTYVEFQLKGRVRELFDRFVDQFDGGNRHLENAFGER